MSDEESKKYYANLTEEEVTLLIEALNFYRERKASISREMDTLALTIVIHFEDLVASEG